MKRNKKGISLIVLVITIIVMIILAAAVMISLSNTGILNKANEAVDATNIKEVEQLATLAWSEAYLDNRDVSDAETKLANITKAVEDALKNSGVDTNKYVPKVTMNGVTITVKGDVSGGWTQTGHTVTNGTLNLTVGDYIDYKANVDGYEDANGWRVLGAENGELLIVSAGEVVDKLKLGGSTLEEAQAAYAGGALTALQTAVNDYGSGDKATGVRSIKVEDIGRIAECDVTTYTSKDFIEFLITMEGGRIEDVPAEGLASIQEMYKIYDYGRILTFKWDGTEYPIYNSTNGTSLIPDSLNEEHDAFTWYDEDDKVWRTATKSITATTEAPIDIVDDTDNTKVASVTNNLSMYVGTKLGENTAAYEMLIADEGENLEYWLASSSAGVDSFNYISYGVHAVYSGLVSAINFVNSTGWQGSSDWLGVRAVVSLESDIQLNPNGANNWKIAN